MQGVYSGILVSYYALPHFFSVWVCWVDPLTLMSRGLLANTLHRVRIKCGEVELVSFEPPVGKSCNEYAGKWLATARGYIVDGNATDTCQYCPLKSGDEYLDSLNI